MLNWRQQAIADIKRHERCRLTAYQDQGGVWTIGWGHTDRTYPGQVCTQTQADEWFDRDFAIAEMDLNVNASWWMFAPAPVRRGLVNMSFNLGWPRLEQFRMMLAAGESGEWDVMADEAIRSLWATQVGNRAIEISDLFRSAAQMELAV